jgi:hypothetical protein
MDPEGISERPMGMEKLGMEKLATDGSNWPLWQATLLSYFESKNLLKHIEGSAVKPPDPPTFTAPS